MAALIVANSLALASLLIMLSSGLALIYGVRDVINLGHGALYMLGAYLGYSLARVGGFWFALVAAPALLGLVGVALKYAMLRPLQRRSHIEVALVTLGRGVLLSQMLTLAAGEMASHGVMLEGLTDYTSGADGLVVSFDGSVLGTQAADFANPQSFWPVAWSAAWAAGLAVWAVRRSRYGAVLRAIRVNEERMSFSGFDTYLPCLAAYVFVSAIAAICGLPHALNSGFVSPESLGLSVSTNALVAALIGGTGGSIGPIAGGVVFTFAQDEFGAYGLTQLLTGAAIVVFIVQFPRGVVGGLGERIASRLGGKGRR